MSLPDFFTSHFSADKAKREAVTWRRHEKVRCHCGGAVMIGELDSEPVAIACADCPRAWGVSNDNVIKK